MFLFILLFLITSNCSSYLQARTQLISKRIRNEITVAAIEGGLKDSLEAFDQITKSLLGAVGPLALGIFLLTRQDQKIDAVNKATSEAIAKDIKAAEASFEKRSALLAKDLKATEASIEKTSALLAKDIEATNASIEKTSALLARDIKANAAAITRLEGLIGNKNNNA